jgi:hypothetical protein
MAVIKLDTDNTMSAEITAVPTAGTLPLDANLSVDVTNCYDGQVRTASVRIDLTLAGGAFHSGWRSGYTNIQPGATYSATIPVHLPLTAPMVGDNLFHLVVEDTTPSPYNQPPYPPAGDTDTDRCTVTGIAP